MIIYYGNGWYPSEKYFTKDDFIDEGLFLLISYANDSKIPKALYISKVFVDSGAFSAWNSGKEININEYIAFVHGLKDRVEVYANLDVIGDYEASFKNYLYLKKAGLEPLPIYHLNSPIEYLHRYAEHSDYIGLGAIAKVKGTVRMKFLDEVFSLYPSLKEKKFHGLGVTDTKLLMEYPWYSVDSTGTIMLGVSGGIMTPWGTVGISKASSVDKVSHMPQSARKQLFEWIKAMGGDPKLAREPTVWGTAERLKINYWYLQSFADKVPEKFTPKWETPSLF